MSEQNKVEHKILTIRNIDEPKTPIEIYPYVDSDSMVGLLSTDKGGTGAGSALAALESLGVNTAINNAIGTLEGKLTGKNTDSKDAITIHGVKKFAMDVLNTVQGEGLEEAEFQNLKACSDEIELNQQNINTLTTNVGTLTTNVGTLNTSVGTLTTNVSNLTTSVSNLNDTKVSRTDILSDKGKILKEKMPYGYGDDFPDEPEEGDIFFLRPNSSS